MVQEQQIQPRQVAYKVRIGDLIRGEYVEQEGWQPNYVIVKDKQVSRVNLIASVIDVQAGESLGTIIIDDGSGTIQVKAFNEDSAKINKVKIGDVVIVIGRPRRYGNQFFISYEIVRTVDPLWAKVRQKEFGDEIIDNVSKNIPIKINIERSIDINSNENRKMILDLIKNSDEGNGANIDEVINKSGFGKEDAEKILEELIKSGEIYENIASRVKLL